MSIDTRPDTQPTEPPATRDRHGDLTPLGLLLAIYRFFYNKRTGLVIILVMGLLTLLGVLFSQAPDAVRDDPAAYAAWLEQARPRYRGWTDPLSFLGIFTMFSSWPFKITTIALALSILACSIHRTPTLLAQATKPHTHTTAGFFEHARLHGSTTVAATPAEALERVRTRLKADRYRILPDEKDPEGGLYADRNRWAPFGTVVAHLAFVIVLAGVLLSSVGGFRDDQFAVGVGSTRPVGHGTNLAIEAKSFSDTYYDDGRPQDYVSDLVIYDNGQQVAQGTIRVNTPLTYGGVQINQAYFGVSADVEVKDAAGAVLHSGGVPLEWTTNDQLYTYGIVPLPQRNAELYVVVAASGQAAGRSLGAGEVRFELYPTGANTQPLGSTVVTQGKTGQVGDLSATFLRESKYTGLIVKRDPGALWVGIGSTLLILGTFVTMFFRHRRIWVRVEPAAGGARVLAGSPDRPDTGFRSRFTALLDSLDHTDDKERTDA